MRRLTRIAALILLPALLIAAFAVTASAFDGWRATAASSGRLAQATDPEHLSLQVYGEPTWPLQRGIDYWNDLAGRNLIHYAGRRMARAAASDPHTVVVLIDALTDRSGVTVGIVGRTAQAITIDPRHMFQWVVYAHEFGHALDVHQDNDPGYDGVMSYASMWDPNPKADRDLVSRQRDAN
jgi:hypothetical protein